MGNRVSGGMGADSILVRKGTAFSNYRSFVSLRRRDASVCFAKYRKAGLNTTNEPVIASTITTATSLVCLLSSLLFSGKSRSTIKIDRQSLPFYGAAAVLALIG
jgi:hypothetical protein